MGPIDLSSVGLLPGVYFMQVEGKETRETVKVVKE